MQETCPTCGGSGVLYNIQLELEEGAIIPICPTCNGTGLIEVLSYY